jgi:membrane-bound serine protease (ClpP class)
VLDILLNPNVAYLFLVGGSLLAVLALLAPGTGVLEISALFALILAGWAVYNLPINLWALIVLLLGVLPFILAVRRTGNLIFLAISIIAMVAGSAFLFQGQGWQPAVNPVLAIIVSSLTGGFFWVVTRKVLEAEQTRPSHDLEALIGRTGEAKTDIHEEGTVQVAGELWTAHSDQPISEGKHIRVIRREGFVLQVEPLEPEEESKKTES